MALRSKTAVLLAIVCLIGGAETACGVTASAQPGAALGLSLHVVRIRDGAAGSTLDTYINDSAAVQRLYTAALQLSAVPYGVYNCPPDNSVVYHLTFSGGTVTARHMDLDAAGCKFLVIGAQAHATTDGFIALFMRTVGISDLDPSLGHP
jgi:hypothetical protein